MANLSSILHCIQKQPAVKLCTVQAWAALRYETPPARQTLYLWCRAGMIEGAVKHGGKWYVPARWKPPAKLRPLITATIPSGGFPIESTTLAGAIADVEDAYRALAPLVVTRTLSESITAAPSSLAEWIPIYLAKIAKRRISAGTVAASRRHLVDLPESLKALPVAGVTTKHIADHLDTLSGTPAQQGKRRSVLLDCFREAIAAGWIDRNPVADTRAERQDTQRARLSLDDYRAIHAYSTEHGPAWATRALELAIVTALRPGDLRALRFDQAHTGYLWVTPAKTDRHGTKIAISLDLRLDALGLSVGEVVASCRDRVVSPLCLHHSRTVGRAKVGAAVGLQAIELEFRTARDACGIKTPAGKTPPMLYEIRSLALRLYEDQGVNIQGIAGHKSKRMTNVYLHERGQEWVKVS